MRRQPVRLTMLATLVLATLLGACEEDRAAVEALQQRAARLADMVDEQNDELGNLADAVEKCQRDLADAENGAAIEDLGNVDFDTPELVGEETVASLERLEASLTKTIDEQKSKISEFTSQKEQCEGDLEAAREAKEAKEAKREADEAKAAAKKTPKTRQRSTDDDDRPAAVKQREAEGKATEGVRSRYRSREQ